MPNRRQFAAGAAILFAAPARGQAWPSRPVKIIVPFAPGGNTDIIARLMGKRLGDMFGQPFVVENRAGANGAIAAEVVARSPKDGYTLFMAALPQIAIFPAMAKLNYDPATDFAPVSNIGFNPFVLAASAKLVSVKTLADFVDHARTAKTARFYGSAGIGSLSHLSMALLLARAGVTLDHVPYQGGAPAMNDVVAGQSPFYFGNLSEVLPHAKTGAVNMIAVSSEARTPRLPDVPTVAESGYPGFKTITWNGLLAPAGTPRDIIDALASNSARTVADAEVRAAFDGFGVTPVGDRPEQFAATIAADIALWAEAVKLAGLEAR